MPNVPKSPFSRERKNVVPSIIEGAAEKYKIQPWHSRLIVGVLNRGVARKNCWPIGSYFQVVRAGLNKPGLQTCRVPDRQPADSIKQLQTA
jgi:hypothetical protein